MEITVGRHVRRCDSGWRFARFSVGDPFRGTPLMYQSYYSLKDEPFRLTPDPRYLHLSAPHEVALTAVLETIIYRKGLVMMTGPIGTGKTTVVHGALQIL